MAQLGAERSRFTGDTKGMGGALLGYGLQKTGVIKNANDLINPASAYRKKLGEIFSTQPRAVPAPVEDIPLNAAPAPGMDANENAAALLPAAPPVAAQPVAPQPVEPQTTIKPVPAQGNVEPLNTDQLVDEIFPRRTSSITPNLLTPRDASSDVAALQMAATPAPPPLNLNQQQGGGGNIMQAILPTLAKLFFA
jgi:hypothetical protein